MTVAATLLPLSAGAEPRPPELPSGPLNPNTRVVVAEDKTQESNCTQWVDSPDNVQPCPEGSIIETRETTYGEVKSRNLTDYQVLTGDSSKDKKLAEQLSLSMHEKRNAKKAGLTSPAIAAGACSAASTSMGRQYMSSGGYAKVEYQVFYSRSVDCYVTNISDQSRVIYTDGMYPWVKWVSSQVDLRLWSRNFTFSYNWTGRQYMNGQITQTGKMYAHTTRVFEPNGPDTTSYIYFQ